MSILGAVRNARTNSHFWDELYFEKLSPDIFLDYWTGIDTDDQTPLTIIYVQLTPAHFSKSSSLQRKEVFYSIRLSIYDQQGNRIETRQREDRVRFLNHPHQKSKNRHRIYPFRVHLSEGYYRVMAQVESDEQIRSVAEGELKITRHQLSKPGISRLLITLPRSAQEDILHAGEAVSPYPVRLFGRNQPEMGCFFLVYGSSDQLEDKVEYRLEIRNEQGMRQYFTAETVFFKRNKLPIYRSVSVATWPAGTYHLRVVVCLNDAINFQESATIFVYQHPLDLHFKPFEQAVKDLSYLLTREELEDLLRTSPQDYQQKLYEIWENYDPTPGTPENEFMESYFQRLRVVKENFWSKALARGEPTDQGWVYLQFGPPDRRIRQFDPIDHQHLEFWEYSSIGARFIFKDEKGLGNYRFFQLIGEVNPDSQR
ncbi:MAG: hypothetical protein Kow0042_06800 [Calditrichia bacterium]